MKNILKHYTIEQNFYNYAVIEKQHNKLQFKKVFRESAIARKDSIVKNIMYSFKSGIKNGMVFSNDIYPVIKSLIYLENMALKVKPKTYFAEDISKILTEISLYQ